MPKSSLYDATFELLHETDNAILVSDDDGKTKHWLPKSQVEWIKVGNVIEVAMPQWLAKEKGIV